MAVGSAAGGAHDGDDLFDLRRVGRVAQTLIGWRVPGMESRQRRRRPPSTGTIEQNLGHDPSSDSRNEPDYRPRLDRADIASDTEQRSTPIRDRYRSCLEATA